MSSDVCIVTGATSGVGLSLAERLADQFIVIGVSRSIPTDKAWASIDAGKRHHVIGDVALPTTVDAAFSAAEQRGSLRLVVNCAGSGVFGPAGAYSGDDVEEALRGNLIGTILFSDRAFSVLKSTGGTIVNLMSTASHVGRTNETVYCATKWGARGYTEALRLEAKGTNVRVVGVYPGGMNTPFWQKARHSQVDSTKFMNPADVADMIMNALAPHANAYVSDLIINRG